ncbi:MAG: hypothetical protein QNJ34_24145 [Xenococcaceae cyanobacterium MO_188.B29]|nr:hypothetical protein [Xenococcaceae cyanobacterium MO_188.B29]
MRPPVGGSAERALSTNCLSASCSLSRSTTASLTSGTISNSIW